MSYAVAAALQEAIYVRISTDETIRDLVGPAIYDAIPPGTPPGTFILVGPEEVIDRSDSTSSGAEHRLQISVISSAAGFHRAKEVAAAISDRMLAEPYPSLARGAVIGLWFQKAAAARMRQGGARRIDLTFRVLVED